MTHGFHTVRKARAKCEQMDAAFLPGGKVIAYNKDFGRSFKRRLICCDAIQALT